MKSTFALQQAFQQTQVATPGGGDAETALQAFSQTAVHAASQVSTVDTAVQQARQEIAQAQTAFQQQVQTLSRSVSAIGGRIDATLAEGGQLQQIRANLNSVSDQVQALRSLGDPTQVTERINLITSLDNRLQRLEQIA
jgi:ppGpp synthetase/RelA/SpoT-type nucleotidyltranferase